MPESRIHAIDRIDLEAPPGLEDDMRWFYGEVAQLDERPDDPGSARICFRSLRIELTITFVENPSIDPWRRRTIRVPSLPDSSELLEEHGVPFERVSGLMFTDRRLQTRDPAGNFVELKQGWPEAPL